MSDPRKKELSITYNGVEAGTDLFPYITSFRYEDAVDASDTISITLIDRDLKWSNDWMPQIEDRIKPSITLKNWKQEGDRSTLQCGDFVVDDFSFSASPVMCEINGVSAPVNTDFKETKRTKTWEAATVHLIAQEIGGKYGLELRYDSVTDVNIEKMEQNEQTDSEFLSKLCEKYGLGMKVYACRLVIWSFEEYFARAPGVTITKDMLSKWTYKSSMQGTYTGAKVTYTPPKGKKGIEVMVGREGRLCSINQKADSEADARLIGENAVRNANRKEITMAITMIPDLSVVATSIVQISGFGKMDGRYMVEKVSHNLSNSSYFMSLSLSRIPDQETKTAGDYQQNGNYIVKSGDSLWAIAKQIYGDPMRYAEIYHANAEAIEQAAKQHGKANSGNGHYIWPGQALIIPGGKTDE